MSHYVFNQLVSSKFKLGLEYKQNVLKRDLKDTICADIRNSSIIWYWYMYKLKLLYFKGEINILEKEHLPMNGNETQILVGYSLVFINYNL